MAAEQVPPRRRGNAGRPALDWEQSFLFYASLPRERRTYAAVAEHYGVSVRTVEKHGRRERWRERVGRIETEAAAEADRRLGKAWSQRLADFEKLIEASCIAYAQQLGSGRVRVTASDLVGLVKISLQLRGEPSERVELVAGSPEWTALRTRILAAVAAYPEAGQALAQAFQQDAR